MKKKGKRKKRHVAMTVISVIFAALAIFGVVSGYISPYEAPVCEYAQLLSPLFVIINLILLLYWIIVFNLKIIIPVVALLFCVGYISGVFQIRVKPSGTRDCLKVLTYNVHSFNDGESAYAVAYFLKNHNIDVACLQECSSDDRVDFAAVFGGYPYRVRRSEFAILSRYPVDTSTITRFVNNGNGALSATIDVDGRKINVMTSHLQTTGISLSKMKYEREGNLSLDRAEDNFANNAKVRAAQALELKAMIEASALPVIFCGDLNDLPSSYSYHKVKGRLKDAFKEAGRGYCYTYLHIMKLLRIDYVFHSPSLKAVEFESPEVDFSDHKPVIAGFELDD